MDVTMLIETLVQALDETFDHHHGMYLDKGTSLFETVDALTAAE